MEKDNYRTGPGSEYNKLKKYGDRGGKLMKKKAFIYCNIHIVMENI